MKNYKLILLSFILIASTSCSNDRDEDVNDTIGSFIFKSTLESAANHVFVSSTGSSNIVNGSGTIQTDFSEQFIPFSLGTIEITEQMIDSDENLIPFRPDKNNNLLFLGELGNYISISHQNESAEFYIPKLVNVTSDSFNNNMLTLSKSNGIEFNWTPDNLNPIGNLFLVIVNRGDRWSETDKPTSIVSEILSDEEGNFLLPNTSLNDFSVGDDVDFYIARGNEMLLGETAFTFYNVNTISGKIVE